MGIISVPQEDNEEQKIILPDEWVLTPLAQDGSIAWLMGREATGEAFIIATAASDERAFQGAQLLKNELALAPHLMTRWAVKPVGHTRYLGRYALVYPAFPFRSLAGIIAMPPEQIADYLRNAIQLCLPLSQAHHQGIVHGDIKPAHLFLNNDGSYRLGGFGLASVTVDSQLKNSLRASGGTLAYMSPAHTGRTPYPVSNLSDLYSLGVVLYEMLTGKLPFGSPQAGPAEWVHHHLATAPRPPASIRPDVPPMLSAIILRLLAKSPMEGYQTIDGLLADLRRCKATLTPQGTIAPFTLGLQERFTTHYRVETLFTGHPQARVLLHALEEVQRSGTHHLVMIGGPPGAGKSAIVASALKKLQHKPILLTVGKADQHSPQIPYSALSTALRTLTLYLLGLATAEVMVWRARLLRALGDDVDLAIELVPELRQLLDMAQPPMITDASGDARERFSQMVCALIKALASSGKALVMLIDDVHWADQASLKLLENVFQRNDHLPFLLVIAHRDAESMPCRQVAGFLTRIRAAAARLTEITPEPLNVKMVARWLAGMLHTRTSGTSELAQLIHEKTGGNPLFLQEFFKQAIDDGLIFSTQDPLKWHYDQSALRARQYTDNVASLVVRQLERMPEPTRQLLGCMACLGAQGQLVLLSQILGTHPHNVQQRLRPAIAARFITLTSDDYAFTHARVHDAAFLLIGFKQKLLIHQQAAALLAESAPRAEGNETLFRAVHHIAMSTEVVLSAAQIRNYFRLSLTAAQRAKRAGDYVSALRYLGTARALNDQRDDGEPFLLGFEEAECQFLQGNLNEAQAQCTALLGMPGSLTEKSAAACLSAEIHMRQSDNYLALETALAWLAVFGVQFNRYPDEAECNAAWYALKARLGPDPAITLGTLPLMANREKESVLNLMASTIFASSYDCPQLHLLLVCKILDMTLDHGIAGASVFGLSWFSVLITDRYQEYHYGFKSGLLASQLAEKHNFLRFKARTLLPLDQVGIWTQPLAFAIDCAKKSFNVALAHGDKSFACLSLRHQVMNYLTRGDHLESVHTTIERGLAFTRQSFYPDVENVLLMQKHLVMHLRGNEGEKFSGVDAFPTHLVGSEPGPVSGPKAMVMFWSWLYRGMAHFYAGEYTLASPCFAEAAQLVNAVPGYIYLMDLHFYSALSLTVPLATGQASAAVRKTAHTHFDQLVQWSVLNPELFADKVALLAAELARLRGEVGEALSQYEMAITLSRKAGYIHINALAYELAGYCAKAWKLEVPADAYLKGAISSWDNWGALAKVRQLEQRYPQLASQKPGNAFTTMPFEDESIRDLESVVTAVRALTEEINLDRLIHILMRMLLERAGAQRCLLIRVLDGNIPETEAWAEANADGVKVKIVKQRPTANDLPLSVLSAVIRTGQEIRTGKPEDFSPFSQDPYLVASGAAVMCVPMFKQANMVGVLYLENRLMPDVFTAEQSHIVKTLSAQAAVSIETARLYAELLEENIHRRRVEKQLRTSQTSLMLGEKISHTGTWSWEIEQDLMSVSDEYLRILGLPEQPKTLSMADFMTFVHPDDHQCIHDLVSDSVQNGISMQAEFRIIRPDGECRYIKGIGDPVNTWPEVKEYFGTISDITVQRRAEDAARMAQADLARVSRATTVGQLTASIAHEINQPLMSIVAHAGASLRWLKREQSHIENACFSLDEILQEGKRAGDIIRGLQALTRKHDSVYARANLHLIARDILALSRAEIERKWISLELKLHAEIAEVYCDRIQIQQVLLNLVVNAIDAMTGIDDRGLILTLATSNPTPDTIRFAVMDTGSGIPDAVKEHIFDSFYTTKKEGMGMGLTISHGIIKKHCGELKGENRADCGSVFWFTLPTEPPASASG
ncbi:AAA family ATPase [Pantoea sp. At-9b]|uniref:ATP-binding sensor histidine kinase n=1 Tax=Pantoea sp. (strain At-9b) TaxID=592316 RepID=UPI0001B3FB30|nr:AAA family ATPase [Pantoea sp. At-9b]ADU69243.1 multi-sensor signal transduction multi-kinase [Pantoea sp. At-9b]